MTYYVTQAGANRLNDIGSLLSGGDLPPLLTREEDFLLLKIGDSLGGRASEARLDKLGYIGIFNRGLLWKLLNKGYITQKKQT